MADQSSKLLVDVFTRLVIHDVGREVRECGLDLGRASSDAEERLDRTSEPFREADLVALEPNTSERGTCRYGSPEAALELQPGFDGEVGEVVVEEAAGINLDPIRRAINTGDINGVADIGQLREPHLHLTTRYVSDHGLHVEMLGPSRRWRTRPAAIFPVVIGYPLG